MTLLIVFARWPFPCQRMSLLRSLGVKTFTIHQPSSTLTSSPPPPFPPPSHSDTVSVNMRRFASFTAAAVLLLLVALPHASGAVDVVGPWNKIVRDTVVSHKLGTSDSSRILATLHLAQFQAVTDLLTTQQKTTADVQKDPQLHTEVLAAVAGAGKAVLEKVTHAGEKPEGDHIFAGPVRRRGKEGEGREGRGQMEGEMGRERREKVQERVDEAPTLACSSYPASCVSYLVLLLVLLLPML